MTTAQEVYRYFLQLIRKENARTVTPAAATILLNAAQVNHLTALIDKVETGQRLDDTFRVITVPLTIIPNSGTAVSEGEIFVLPYNDTPLPGESKGYWRLLNAAFSLKNPDGTPAECAHPSGWTVARPLPRDGRYAVDRNPHWKPTNWEPYWQMTGHTLRCLAKAPAYAQSARVEYIRYPVDMDIVNGINPELPSNVNQEIVHVAVRTHLSTIADPRYQTRLVEQQHNP